MTNLFFHLGTGLVFEIRYRDNGELYDFFDGNLVDGLPPAFSFGVRRDFSIFILRLFESGKFIFDLIILPRFETTQLMHLKVEKMSRTSGAKIPKA